MTTATPPLARKQLTVPHPDTAQSVFRQCLDACARPGTVRRLGTPEVLASLLAGRPAAVAPVLALADLMTPIASVAPETAAPTDQSGEETAAELARLTGAPLGTLADARIALSLGPPAPAALRLLNAGTAYTPHHGALLCQRVESVTGPGDPASAAPRGVDVRLTGPGVKDSSTSASVVGIDPAFFAARADLVTRFPAGIDVLFISDQGDVLGLPRTTKAEVL